MKQIHSLLLALVLVAPATVSAQTGDGAEDGPADAEQPTQPAESGEADDQAEPAAGEESEDGEDVAEEGTAPTAAPAPQPEPEPEVSATAEAEAEADVSLSAPEAPSLAADLAAAESEAAGADADAAQEAGAEDGEDALADEGPKLPWRNSLFLYDNEVSTTTFDGGSSTLSYNPYWTMAFSLRPRWYLTDDISIRLRQDLAIEMTDSDTQPKNHRPVLADTMIDVAHANLFEAYGASLTAAGRLSLPTSIASRSYSKYFGIGPNVAVSRPFEDVLEGAELGLSSSYSYTFAGSNVRHTEDGRERVPQTYATFGSPDPGDLADPQASGTTVVDHAWTLGLSGSISPIEKLSFSSSFTWWWTHGRDATPGCVEVLTDVDGCHEVPDNSETHTRLSTWFTLGASYQVLDWLGTELTYSHLTGEFNPDASRRNPFWSVDSTVSLTASITLDKLYQDFSGTGSSPGEVVERESNDDNDAARAAAPNAAVAW